MRLSVSVCAMQSYANLTSLTVSNNGIASRLLFLLQLLLLVDWLLSALPLSSLSALLR